LRRLFLRFRKGDEVQVTIPEKIGLFAQDMCSYRVSGKNSQQNAGQQGRQG
jgi:hypothetical protein